MLRRTKKAAEALMITTSLSASDWHGLGLGAPRERRTAGSSRGGIARNRGH